MKYYNGPSRVKVAEEKWVIPTYPIPAAEEMPMFAETSNHQGTTGNPYPNRVVSEADGEHKEDKEWTVIRLENDYIRLAILPALGGRIFEAYDKTTGYDFLYRQHVIKPALIGAYGSWISGGIEFNWPFHHRPSTVMPVDYTIEEDDDTGAVTVWLSEHAPNDRTKGMVGVVLTPDTSFFETRMVISNRTPVKHNFLWWENAAVAVHEDYRLVFPPDVTWVHHHNDAGHTTFPIAQGQYGADNIKEPKDISWHKNSRLATSYFAAPSKYDFFGGYDYRRECGILHIADHHISPGKKMFTWGYGSNAENWEKKLTDADGPYAELMAGSYTDDQPDFTWLQPYETKSFSQFWYPTQGIGYTSFATLDAAVALDREKNEIRVNVTSEWEDVTTTVYDAKNNMVAQKTAPMKPSEVVSFPFDFSRYPGEKLYVTVVGLDDDVLLTYKEEDHDYVHIPKDNKGIPTPDKLKTPMELVLAGMHLDQYRSPIYKPDVYYLEALRRDPDFLPALKGIGEFYTRVNRFSDGLAYLDRAWDIECRYNQNPEDGTVGYLRGYCLERLGRYDDAYDAYARAAWSNNVYSPAMTALAALDGLRGDYFTMSTHALNAVEKEARNVTAMAYAALAALHLQDEAAANEIVAQAQKQDPINHLIRAVDCILDDEFYDEWIDGLCSDPAQTALDVAFDLLRAGEVEAARDILQSVTRRDRDNAMVNYTLAYIWYDFDDDAKAQKYRRAAKKQPIVSVFPARPEEEIVLGAALYHDPKDGFASYLLGCMKYHAQEYTKAAELWAHSVQYMPKFYIPYRNLALVYFNHMDRAEEALPLLRRAVELHPGDATLLSETATVMQALASDGDDNAAFLEQYKPKVMTDQMQLTIARAYNAAGAYDKAEAAMRAHTFSPGEGAEFSTAEPYMNACFLRGRMAMKEGRYEDALADFRAAQKMPENLNVGFWNESVMMPYMYYEAAALKANGQTAEADAIIAKLSQMKDVGMWNMGGEFIYYYAMAVRLGGEEMRAQKMIRDAILRWEEELAGGCTYHRSIGGLYNCFVGNQTRARLGTLYGMLGYGHLFNGDKDAARENFSRSMALSPSAKIAFELQYMA